VVEGGRLYNVLLVPSHLALASSKLCSSTLSILATGSASHFDSFIYLRIRKTFMRRTHQHSFTHFSQSPLVSSRFKEHLSIAVPPLDSDLFHERSYIFPGSPIGCAIPSGGLIFSHRSSSCTRSLDLENSSTGDSNSSPQRLVQPSVRDRLARLFPVLRLSRTRWRYSRQEAGLATWAGTRPLRLSRPTFGTNSQTSVVSSSSALCPSSFCSTCSAMWSSSTSACILCRRHRHKRLRPLRLRLRVRQRTQLYSRPILSSASRSIPSTRPAIQQGTRVICVSRSSR